ncbi:MAG TPA: HprK-related kinase A [Casimicrobiaceae bacterium]|nr:HprK-related kinase A [Casimicrobiaceae bacterium]
MTRLADVAPGTLAALLAGGGVALDFGAARARIRADVPALVPALQAVYGAFEHDPDARFHDVSVRVHRRGGLRRVVAPQILMDSDADVLFEPFPAATHLPLLEWGINYLFAQRLNHRLLLHAGVVEIDGRAVVMPALPGTGKSTLTAALATAGARLLSDEFGVVDLDDATLHPLVRPVSLKNASIDVIAAFAPHAVMGPRFPGTRKGTVAHLAPDARSYAERGRPTAPGIVLFPRFEAGAAVRVEPMPKARAFAKLAVNSFNYELLGPDGFDAVGRLLQSSLVFRLDYSRLDEAVAAVRDLVATRAAHG